MTMQKNVKNLCLKYFDFLKRDYGFRLAKKNENNKLCFKTNAVGVAIEYEPREFYLFVTLCKLRDGEFPSRTKEIKPETIISCFDLDDVVTLRSKSSLIPSYTSLKENEIITLEQLIEKQAKNLQNFACDILKADFSLFVELEKIVKDRARQSAIARWGVKAIEFGWSLDED